MLLVSFGLYGWRLQSTQGAALLLAGQEQMTRCFRLPAPRGSITDRHDAPLAVNAVDVGPGVDQVLVVPALLRARSVDIDRLADLVGRSHEDLRMQIGSAAGPTLSLPVAEVQRGTADAVSGAGIAGVFVVPDPRRFYPAGPLLGTVLGFTGVATPDDVARWPDLPPGAVVGRAGLEQQYDAVLRGVDGQQCLYVDPRGVPVALAGRVDPVRGTDVRLSIDLGLQRQLDASLAAAVRAQPRPRGSIGAAVALDPRSGQVLAMASTPSFDNNIYGPPLDRAALKDVSDAPGSPMLEHVTQAVAPPGSTFKLVVAAANQAHPVFPPRRAIPTGADFTYGGHTFGNWKPMGPMNMVQSIAMSNDVYFYKLAVALGPEAVIDTARALGVDSGPVSTFPRSPPATSAARTPSERTVGRGSAGPRSSSASVRAICRSRRCKTRSLDRRGRDRNLVTPRLGLAVGTGAGTYTALPPPTATPLPFADALGPVREGMRAAVTGGTAVRPADLGARRREDRHRPGRRTPRRSFDNWMTAAAPHDDPEIVVTALVQGPGTGGNSAKSVVSDGLRHYLEHRADVLATGPVQTP
jgi:cell division protein FtsI/penicillin-binding protein 2